MVDIYRRPFIRSKTRTDTDLSKYATKDEVDELLNPAEVAIFQDKQGKLKTSDIKWNDIIHRVLGATTGNFPEFTDGGRIKDSNISMKDISNKITASVADRVETIGNKMTRELNLNGNKITVLKEPTSPEDAANKQYIDAGDTANDAKLITVQTKYETRKRFKKYSQIFSKS